MNNQELLRQIENKATREKGDPFVLLEPAGPWMINRCGLLVETKFPQIPVRSEVKKMLDRVDKIFKQINPNYQLVVARGWGEDSCIEVPQVEDELLKILSESHLTGGAVDVFIGRKILGSGNVPIIDEIPDGERILNREMANQGFAPLNGVPGHFSYGDKVHAVYYQWGGAIYGSKSRAEMSAEVGILNSNLVIRP